MLRESRADEVYHRYLVSPLSRLCLDEGIRPNDLSLSALVASAAAALVFVVEPAIGGGLYLISGVLDTLDGAVSRASERHRRAGAFLDSMLDRYTELLVLLGVLGFYARELRLSAALAFVVVLAGFGSWMVSYAQSRAEGLKSSCSYGFFERPERLIVLCAGAIVSPWVAPSTAALPWFLDTRPALGGALLVLAVGTNVTALRRLYRGYRKLAKEDESARRLESRNELPAAEQMVDEQLRETFPASDPVSGSSISP